MAIYFDNSNITTGSKGEAGYTPIRGTDYWTDTDIAEIKKYVDETASEALDSLNIDSNTTTTLNGILKGNGSKVQAAQKGVDYAAPALLRTVTLAAGEWSNNTQTVIVSGVLADTTKQAIHVSPAPGYGTMYGSAGIECTVQAANSLTFSCEAAPESDITVNIVIQEAKV